MVQIRDWMAGQAWYDLKLHRLGLPEQLHQRQFQQRLNLSSGPVVAEGEGRLVEGGGQERRKSQGETGSTPPKRRWRLW